VIVDSRVIDNYISPGCVKRYYIKICDKEKLYKLALADGSPAGQTGWINTETIPIILNIQKH
jgi:hypothetical protein